MMGFVAQVTQGVSDAISDVGKEISNSPLAQGVITVGGAMLGIPPSITAAVLGANQASQTGDISQGLLTGGMSYLGGTGVNNYASTGSLFGNSATTGMTSGMTQAQMLEAQTAGMFDGMTQSQMLAAQTAGMDVGSTAAAGAKTGLGSLWNTATSSPNALGAAMQLGGSYLSGNAANDAAATQAQAQIRAAQIAADAAKFRPVGVTTNFGSSKFGYDANGNLISAGYGLNPLLQGQQNQLLGASQGMLNQFTGSQAATAPMGDAAQRMMSLGNQYLATDPQAQAAKFLSEQQGLLAPNRASTLADLQATMQAQGRGGFAIGGGVNGQGAANPQMQALFNAQLQQDAQLAANATQGGMDYAKFGGAMVGSGGDMLKSMYGTQTAAYQPYQTALGGAQTIEGMGQNALDMGINLGAKGTAANAASGQLLASGMTNAANTIGQTAQQVGSPWGNMLTGAGTSMQNYQNQQAQQQYLQSLWGK